MTAPPGIEPITDDRPPVSSGDAHLALLIREARDADPALRDIGKRDLMRMGREFAAAREHDLSDDDARSTAREEFGGWLRSNYWRCLRGGLYARDAS